MHAFLLKRTEDSRDLPTPTLKVADGRIKSDFLRKRERPSSGRRK